MEQIAEFVDDDEEAFKDRMDIDPELWTKIEQAAERSRRQRDKKQEALKKCYELWGEDNVKRHFRHLLDKGDYTWAKVRRLAMKHDLKTAVGRIREAIYWRVTNPRPGCESSDEGEHRCGCAVGIPTVFVTRCSTKRALNPGNQVLPLKEWAEHRDGGKITCFQHSRGIASRLGMQTRGLTAAASGV